jgi:hypothetical protein
MPFLRAHRALFALVAVTALAAPARAKDCDLVWPGLVPLSDPGNGLYLGRFERGLYPGSENEPPPAHRAEGVARARAIAPLDTSGSPSATGRVVLLSIGMSNASQEFCSTPGTEPCNDWSFMGQAAEHPQVDREHLVIVNGARGGQVATEWDSPLDTNYNLVRDNVLEPRGLSEAQVQVVWLKSANANPGVDLADCGADVTACPGSPADAALLEARLASIARAIRVRYPNAALLFLSSRIFGGYSTLPLNPEPYAYESGFAVKWLIEAQIEQMSGGGADPWTGDLDWDDTVPWLGWGPYPWANGATPRSDGLAWPCSDFENDGVHPGPTAEEKVGAALLDFFLDSPFATPWFRVPEPGAGVLGAAALVALCALARRTPRGERERAE